MRRRIHVRRIPLALPKSGPSPVDSAHVHRSAQHPTRARTRARTRPLRRLPLHPGLSEPVRPARARVVHAPGRPVAAGVSGGTRPGQHLGRHRPARAGGRAHLPARRPVRHRRRHLLQRHRRARGCRRIRGRCRSWYRAGRIAALPVRSRPAEAPSARARARHPVRDRGRADSGRNPRRPPHRLRRRPLHRGELPGGRRPVEELHPGQGAHASRARPLARPRRAPDRHGPGLSALAARRRGIRHPGVRQLGGHPDAPSLRGAGITGHPTADRRPRSVAPGDAHHLVRCGNR